MWTIKNSKIYDITYSAPLSNYSYYMPVIQNMIKSFQFDNSVSNISKSAKQQAENNGADGQNMTQFRGLGIRINYPIDWKEQKKVTADNATADVILHSPFQDELSEKPSWHETTFTMAIAIGSVQHPAVTDYRVILSRSPINNRNNSPSNNAPWVWTRKVVEVSAYDKQRVLEEEKNYRAFHVQMNLIFCFLLT